MARSWCVLGIDPGVNGAVALLELNKDGSVLAAEVKRIPTVPKPGSKRGKLLDEEGVPTMLSGLVRKRVVALVAMERIQARPGQSAPAMWAFGSACGFLKGVVRTMRWPLVEVVPRAWRRALGLSQDKTTKTIRKAQSRELAQALHPAIELVAAKHTDEAEALLIAEYARMQWLKRG